MDGRVGLSLAYGGVSRYIVQPITAISKADNASLGLQMRVRREKISTDALGIDGSCERAQAHSGEKLLHGQLMGLQLCVIRHATSIERSEERRVGKECRS